MSVNTSLEERLAAVEAAVNELQKQVIAPQTTNWLQQVTGSFKDEPAFEEVLAYGKLIRQGDDSLIEIQLGAMKYLLDTDHLSIIQRQTGQDYINRSVRMAQYPLSDFAISIVTFH